MRALVFCFLLLASCTAKPIEQPPRFALTCTGAWKGGGLPVKQDSVTYVVDTDAKTVGMWVGDQLLDSCIYATHHCRVSVTPSRIEMTDVNDRSDDRVVFDRDKGTVDSVSDHKIASPPFFNTFKAKCKPVPLPEPASHKF
jgi:hypothetical protein